MGNGTVTPEELAKKLVNAKKVMNKVETGNFEKGHVNENILSSDPMDLMTEQNLIPKSKTPMVDENRIKNSKLPDNIKQAMIDVPIIQPEISLSEGFDLKLAQKAKKLMEQDGSMKSKAKPTSNSIPSPSNININEIITAMTPVIENTIRKIFDEKLTQILTAKDTMSLNENLVLKVGDSIFKGTITGVNKKKK